MKERGLASWYGRKFHGQKTSSGEVYDMFAMTAAHKTLPIPSYARVTSLKSGQSVVVRVNDRGPFHDGRVIDLSYAAAARLGIAGPGSGPVEVERVFARDAARVAAAPPRRARRPRLPRPRPAPSRPRSRPPTCRSRAPRRSPRRSSRRSRGPLPATRRVFECRQCGELPRPHRARAAVAARADPGRRRRRACTACASGPTGPARRRRPSPTRSAPRSTSPPSSLPPPAETPPDETPARPPPRPRLRRSPPSPSPSRPRPSRRARTTCSTRSRGRRSPRRRRRTASSPPRSPS